jgi:hypothetical protein
MLIVIVNSSSRLVFLLKLFVRQIISVDLDDYNTHFVNSELEKLISTVLSATNFGKLVPEMVKRSPPRTLISVSGIMAVTVQSTLILGTLGSVGIKP